MERIPRIAVCDDDTSIHDRIYELLFTYSKQGKATRIGRKLNADGKLVRFAKKSGEEI